MTDRPVTAGDSGPPRLEHLVHVPVRTAARRAVDVDGRDLDGAPRRLALTVPGRWTLLVFVGPHCDACEPFWSASASASRAELGLHTEDAVELVVRPPATRKDRDELLGVARTRADRARLFVSDDAWSDYGVLGAPFFVLVDGETVVTEGVAWSMGQVGGDVGRARAGHRGPASR